MAIAQTDLLKLDSYKEGDIPSYGENLVVKQDEKTGIKWISRGVDTIGSGTIKFPMKLSGDFELFIQIYSAGNEVMLLTSDEYRIKLDWYFHRGSLDNLAAGKDKVDLNQSDAAKDGINKIIFSVVNNVAKVYMNEVFDGKITLKPDLGYTQLIIQKITASTKIYALTTTGSPTTQPTSTSNNCMANYSSNGKLHIPCVTAPNKSGGTSVYDITMQKQSSGFVFNVDMNSIKPR
jgi:hypothetical protein